MSCTNPVRPAAQQPRYTQTGSYTVTLTTAVVTETDTLTRTSYITVSAGGCVTPTAGFSGSPLTGTVPLTVSFTDASSGTISSRWWSFGDGGSSSETNPSHSHTQTGAFTVSPTLNGTCGSDVLTRTNVTAQPVDTA